MPYVCVYPECKKIIPEDKAIRCGKCRKKFHEECFKKHNFEQHNGKAIGVSSPDPDLPSPIGIHL